ncbi:natural resistance-associated macrophage protein, partial [Sistotremastrum niveocremeum HHB9708]
VRRWTRVVWRHFQKHAGAGILASVAYFDPGNWSVDLQAGSLFGYKLLFVVLMAGLGAVVLQIMAAKLGCVTGRDLAVHCRQRLSNHPRHPHLVRYLVLYPLYAASEIAIISTDLAELLGSAIALNLLIPRLPLFAAVLLTSFDVFVVLLLGDPSDRSRPIRVFELGIAMLVFVVFICFIILIVEVSPQWGHVFQGFLPSKAVFKSEALYTSIGIIGATVMPHALFLGSSLATQDREASSIQLGDEEHACRATEDPSEDVSEAPNPRMSNGSQAYILKSLWLKISSDEVRSERKQNNKLAFIRAHLMHSIIDISMSLMGFAVVINSAILILAGAVFFYDSTTTPGVDSPASLFDAYALIHQRMGKAAAITFALALLASGQSASITATLAGQIVSNGFINWNISPFKRRLITRSFSLLPSTIIAAALGKSGIDSLLVASQVVLSFVLPFVIFPLVWLTSKEDVMWATVDRGTGEGSSELRVNYKNGKAMMTLGYLIWIVVVLANAYAIVALCMGQ